MSKPDSGIVPLMMSDAANEPIGYAAAADAYWHLGWRGVLPLKHKRKWPPPPFVETPDGPSFTGYAGIDPSYADVMAWSDDFRDGNLCLRLPDGIVGIDVDAYDDKTGGQTLAVAIARWGPLPPTVRSTSRLDDPVSGIRLYRVPPGTHLETKIGFSELGIGGIEVIQRHHRYTVAWPSIHPEERMYSWCDEQMNVVPIPAPGDLPWLPQPWIDALHVQHRSNLDNLAIDVRSTLTEGTPSPTVQARLTQAIREVGAPGADRHDTTLPHVLALMRLGKDGQPGVKAALQLLCNVFVACVTSDGSRSETVARNEFERMVTNDNAARELAEPSITDWVKDMVIDDASPATNDPEPETAAVSPDGAPAGDGAANANAPGDNKGRTPDPTKPRSPLEEIEQGFWDSRESLRMVWQTSMARMCPPWAVLAHVAARALTLVRPCVTLPPLIGGPGSLNWFAAVVAPSGGGKGASSSCSRLLVPAHVETRNVGSGEGILAAFGRPSDDDDPAPIHEALMFTADEVDTLAAMNQRSASTTLSILRSGFSGETIGFSYAAREKRRHIGAHTYRMTFVVSVQPTRAAWLIDDGGGGTPQRFMWFPGTDNRITKDRPWEAGALTLPEPGEWLYPREIVVPEQAANLILDERVKAMQGDQSALDGHALYCREKFAYALAVLDGRVQMTDEDWELSGIASAVSNYTREQMAATIAEAARGDAAERGILRGVENEAADLEKQLAYVERVQRVLRWLLNKIEEFGTEGVSLSDLKRRAAGRDRPVVEAALQSASQLGLVEWIQDSDRWRKR